MGKIIENYSLLSEVGRGVYSTVYKAVNLQTQQPVAIKMVSAQRLQQTPKLLEGTYNEVHILAALPKCPNIVRYIDMLKTSNNYYFVYEFCNGGTLENILKQKKYLPQEQALDFFCQLLEAFKVLSTHNVMHRDVKPDNILLDNGILKLGDFGFCKPLANAEQLTQTMLGSPIYMAPQVLRGEKYSVKADIWSLGVVLFRMLFGEPPFSGNNLGELILAIYEQQVTFPHQPFVSKHIIVLLQKMLVKDPRARASWGEIFNYPIRDSPPKTGKDSTTTVDNSLYRSRDLAASLKTRGEMQKREKSEQKKDLFEQSIKVGPVQPLRNTFGVNSSFRTNFSRDLMIKNHYKSTEIVGMALALMNLEEEEGMRLAWLLLRTVEKELRVSVESARKELAMRGEEQAMRHLLISAEEEVEGAREVLRGCESCLTEEGVAVEGLSGQGARMLWGLMGRAQGGEREYLVLLCRLGDYFKQGLVIKRDTFQRMSRERLLANVRQKMQLIQN